MSLFLSLCLAFLVSFCQISLLAQDMGPQVLGPEIDQQYLKMRKEEPIEPKQLTGELKLIKAKGLSKFEQKLQEPLINDKYYRGENLIYDCEGLFFACVNSDSFEKCKLPCVPLKRYIDQQTCFENQYQQMYRGKQQEICFQKKK